MAALELKYDSEYDSWILEPIQLSNVMPTSDDHRRHSSAETASSSPARASYSSTESLRFFSRKRLQSYLADVARCDNTRLWKKLKRYFTCYKPQFSSDDHDHATTTRLPKKKKQRVDNYSSYDAFKANTSNSYGEQEENLKAVVLYCKSTMDSPTSTVNYSFVFPFVASFFFSFFGLMLIWTWHRLFFCFRSRIIHW